jgi:hypothetical protein
MTRRVVSLATAAAVLLALGWVGVQVAVAAPAAVAGTWDAPDLGAGGHGGGPLLTDGQLGGNGHVVFRGPLGLEEADFAGGTWSIVGLGQPPTVRLSLRVTPIRDPAGFFARGVFVFDVLADGRPHVVHTASGFTTLTRVRLIGRAP